MNRIEPTPWRGIRALEKLLIITPLLLAAAAFVVPFLDQALLRRLARVLNARPLVAWLASGYNAWIVGGALLLLSLLVILAVRARLVRNKRLWYGTGCPNCMERELVRVSRKTSDRFYSLMAIPAYRYACRNCTWRGLRIARREHSPEREAELEASLLRFEPDGLGVNRVADQGDQEAAEPAARPLSNGSTPYFRDAGDVQRVENHPAAEATDLDETEVVEESNHHNAAEPEDEIEWLWRRSADR